MTVPARPAITRIAPLSPGTSGMPGREGARVRMTPAADASPFRKRRALDRIAYPNARPPQALGARLQPRHCAFRRANEGGPGKYEGEVVRSGTLFDTDREPDTPCVLSSRGRRLRGRAQVAKGKPPRDRCM